MIPKLIHYCWFGGKEKPDSVKQCIESWKKYCPDYEIREWNESNFDIQANDYCREAYEAKRWAFVADYARLYVLYEYGGIYMDTDVEVVRPFDPLLNQNGFLCFENDDNVSIGTFGAARHLLLVNDFLQPYKGRHFKRDDGSFDMTTNLKIITQVLVERYGISLNGKEQVLSGDILVLPMEAFIAKSYLTGWIMRDENTYAIHHYSATWRDAEEQKRAEKQSYYVRKYMKMCEGPIARLAMYHTVLDFYGVKGFTMKAIHHILKRSGGVDRPVFLLSHFYIGEPHEAVVSHFQGASA